LLLLSNKIREKGKIVSAWKQGGRGREGVGQQGRGWGEEGRNDPNIVCTYE
jgi:hypothetical protein